MRKLEEKMRKRLRRKMRIRKKIRGTVERPRMTIYKSNRFTYVQVVDDTQGRTLASASTLDQEVKGGVDGKGKTPQAGLVGTLVAKRALEKGISKVVFDRGGHIYHGRVKALAEAARQAGLKF